jgi:hypothetical protein
MMLFDTIDAAVHWAWANRTSDNRGPVLVGIDIFMDAVDRMCRGGARTTELLGGYENIVYYHSHGQDPLVISKMIPSDKVYIGTEDQYLRELAEQECRKILLKDET